MQNFTADEQAVIDAQGWDDDSMLTVLGSFLAKPEPKGTLIEHMRAMAAEENGEHAAPCGQTFDTEKAAADHQWHCDQCAGAVEAQGSNVVRYLLVEITLPDGSAGTGDPERAHRAIMGEVSEFVAGDPRVTDVEVTQVMPGDVVSAEDVPEDTTAEDDAAKVEKALNALLSDSTVAEVGQHMSCGEVDAFATVLAVLGRTDDAALWLLAHSHDDEGDLTDNPDDAFDNAGHLAMRDADGDDGIGSQAGLAAAHDYLTTLLAVA
jgi:hypothetical protein